MKTKILMASFLLIALLCITPGVNAATVEKWSATKLIAYGTQPGYGWNGGHDCRGWAEFGAGDCDNWCPPISWISGGCTYNVSCVNLAGTAVDIQETTSLSETSPSSSSTFTTGDFGILDDAHYDSQINVFVQPEGEARASSYRAYEDPWWTCWPSCWRLVADWAQLTQSIQLTYNGGTSMFPDGGATFDWGTVTGSTIPNPVLEQANANISVLLSHLTQPNWQSGSNLGPGREISPGTFISAISNSFYHKSNNSCGWLFDNDSRVNVVTNFRRQETRPDVTITPPPDVERETPIVFFVNVSDIEDNIDADYFTDAPGYFQYKSPSGSWTNCTPQFYSGSGLDQTYFCSIPTTPTSELGTWSFKTQYCDPFSGPPDNLPAGEICDFDEESTDLIPGNLPPGIISITLTPTNPLLNDDLTSTIQASDPEGDPLQYMHYLYYNENDGSGFKLCTVSDPKCTVPAVAYQLELQETFDSSITKNKWSYQIYGVVWDGSHGQIDVGWSNIVTITNTPPTQPTTVDITPTPAYDEDDLLCTATGSTDADAGDIVNYNYKWMREGLEIGSDDGAITSTLSNTITDIGDTIECIAEATDGYDVSLPRSDTVTIIPRPSASISILSIQAISGGTAKTEFTEDETIDTVSVDLRNNSGTNETVTINLFSGPGAPLTTAPLSIPPGDSPYTFNVNAPLLGLGPLETYYIIVYDDTGVTKLDDYSLVITIGNPPQPVPTPEINLLLIPVLALIVLVIVSRK